MAALPGMLASRGAVPLRQWTLCSNAALMCVLLAVLYVHSEAAFPRASNTLYVVDTDMGDDDVGAIALLLSQNVQVVGITTSDGLCRTKVGANNALRLLAYLDGHNGTKYERIPVYYGIPNPLQGNDSFTSSARNESERIPSTYGFPRVHRNVSGDAIQFLHDVVNAYPHRVTIITLGPLTNIATLIMKYPLWALKVQEIVMMGGGIYDIDNGTPDHHAEWNMWVDPYAASVVFNTPNLIKTMLGLDVMNYAGVTDAFYESLETIVHPSPVARILLHVTREIRTWDDKYLYDMVMPAWVLRQEMFSQIKTLNVSVIGSGENRGETIISRTGHATKVPLFVSNAALSNWMMKIAKETSARGNDGPDWTPLVIGGVVAIVGVLLIIECIVVYKKRRERAEWVAQQSGRSPRRSLLGGRRSSQSESRYKLVQPSSPETPTGSPTAPQRIQSSLASHQVRGSILGVGSPSSPAGYQTIDDEEDEERAAAVDQAVNDFVGQRGYVSALDSPFSTPVAKRSPIVEAGDHNT